MRDETRLVRTARITNRCLAGLHEAFNTNLPGLRSCTNILSAKETLRVTAQLRRRPIETKAGSEATIVAHADVPKQCNEFIEEYRGANPFWSIWT